MERNFMQLLDDQKQGDYFLCVGLDTDVEKIPKDFYYPKRTPGYRVLEYNKMVVDATFHVAAAYKPNLAFYQSLGSAGIDTLIDTCHYIKSKASDLVIILDAKYGDIGNTNEHYAKFAFDILGADAVTVHNYMGHEGMKPFLERKDKGVIVLCRTSNPGSDELQCAGLNSQHMFRIVAQTVETKWNYNKNCMLVMGATYAEDFSTVRSITQMPFLVPGIGAQGGDLEDAVRHSMTEDGGGFLINSSRGIIFPKPVEGQELSETITVEAVKLHNAIKEIRKKVLAEKQPA